VDSVSVLYIYKRTLCFKGCKNFPAAYRYEYFENRNGGKWEASQHSISKADSKELHVYNMSLHL
jgi:hypothetical protein